MTAQIQADPQLRERFAGASFEGPIRVLGPLAVESPACGVPGLLLAGDAAGFIDPMTGDGLHLAMRGGWLAAGEALHALETGDLGAAVQRLTRARAETFSAKLRFNRWLRRLVEAPAAVELAGLGGAMAPGLVRWAVTRAGRCGVNTVAFVAAVVIGCLLAETRVSRANERRLRERGAIAPPGDVYKVMAVLYPAAFVAMAAEGMWRAAHETAPPTGGPNWFVSGVLLFVASKALKYWAIRIARRALDVPGVHRARSCRWSPPDPIATWRIRTTWRSMGELVSTAMMCGAPIAGAAGVILFGAVLWMRVRFESGVLRRVAGRE